MYKIIYLSINLYIYYIQKKEKTNKDIFIENWQQIQVYYYKGFMNSSKPISQTGLTHKYVYIYIYYRVIYEYISIY